MKRSIDLDEKLIKKNRIPLLYNEPSWVKLFGKARNRNIQRAREELIALVEKEKELDIKTKDLQREKLKAMKMILGISDSVNNENKPENIRLLDEYKNKVERINEELNELIFQLETMPKEIREANLNLLNATIEYGYRELNNREKILKQSIEEIDVLRTRLKELIKIKHDYEEWINETYRFFHGLLGSDTIEKIDEERLR
ncbi:MAG: hypothetical protein GX300_03560 [Tissierellia bacterium]|nr:hypothetical protein [Tissierellia bacterium]